MALHYDDTDSTPSKCTLLPGVLDHCSCVAADAALQERVAGLQMTLSPGVLDHHNSVAEGVICGVCVIARAPRPVFVAGKLITGKRCGPELTPGFC